MEFWLYYVLNLPVLVRAEVSKYAAWILCAYFIAVFVETVLLSAKSFLLPTIISVRSRSPTTFSNSAKMKKNYKIMFFCLI